MFKQGWSKIKSVLRHFSFTAPKVIHKFIVHEMLRR